MGTFEVYEVLQELGGKATGAEIKQALLKKYPDGYYHTYAMVSLRRLAKSGRVKSDLKNRTYSISGPFGERNVVSIGKDGKTRRVEC